MNPLRRAMLAGLPALPLLIRDALAMAGKPISPGFHKLEGSVFLNGQAARIGDVVKGGDAVATGPDGMAIFVMERDAFLLRASSRVEISHGNLGVRALRLLTGRLLSVFGKGEKQIHLPMATIGIRGTAVYAEVQAQRAYFCTCYGLAEIVPLSDPAQRETVRTRHHDAPRYIYAAAEEPLIRPAPVINHSDAELVMLEALVERVPEFYKTWGEDDRPY